MFEFAEKMLKKMTIWDMSMVKMSSLLAWLIIAKLYPEILSLDIWHYVIAFTIVTAIPMYRLMLK